MRTLSADEAKSVTGGNSEDMETVTVTAPPAWNPYGWGGGNYDAGGNGGYSGGYADPASSGGGGSSFVNMTDAQVLANSSFSSLDSHIQGLVLKSAQATHDMATFIRNGGTFVNDNSQGLPSFHKNWGNTGDYIFVPTTMMSDHFSSDAAAQGWAGYLLHELGHAMNREQIPNPNTTDKQVYVDERARAEVIADLYAISTEQQIHSADASLFKNPEMQVYIGRDVALSFMQAGSISDDQMKASMALVLSETASFIPGLVDLNGDKVITHQEQYEQQWNPH